MILYCFKYSEVEVKLHKNDLRKDCHKTHDINNGKLLLSIMYLIAKFHRLFPFQILMKEYSNNIICG